MAKFDTGVPCPDNTVNFFSEMRYDADSYSCAWDTKTNPDNDFDDTRHVYLQVLDKFNIPVTFPNGTPARGLLPGIDINQMSAIEAIKLSLAENLLDGQWWEIIEDGLGGVIIQLIYNGGDPGKIITLDPRMCIPTLTKQSDTDMVIVTGYDPPPCRSVGYFYDVVPKGFGIVNPSTIPKGTFTVDEALMFDVRSPCHARQLHTTVTKSYVDPLIEGDDVAFGSQTVNPFFDPKAFEKLAGWVVKVEGMPEGEDQRAKVSYNFSKTTNWLYEVPGKVDFNKVTTAEKLSGLFCPDDNIVYYKADIRVPNQTFIDKYGSEWPLIIKPENVLYLGYKVTQITAFPTGGGDQLSYVIVNPTPELISSDGAAKWTYVLDESSNDFIITMYYQPKQAPEYWDTILTLLEGETQIKIDDQSGNITLSNAGLLPKPFFGSTKAIISGPDGIGYYATGVWIDFSIDRSSVVVTTSDGTPARPWSDELHIQYAPIVITDLPAEKAYIEKGGVAVELDVSKLGLSTADADPTTCQNFENTPEAIMQDKMQGNVVNVTFPFCPDAETCADVATAIMGYQDFGTAKTYALTCGPDDEPEIGAAVDGYDSNLRIESINYSYNDGSAYTIEVSLGATFSSVGSWGQGNFGGTYEPVSRQGIIIWAGGDGVNYRVRVQGLGEYAAINTQTDVYRVGERVQVEVRNVPKTVV